MAQNGFGHLDTYTLKKRRKNYNLYSILRMVLVIGGLALSHTTRNSMIWHFSDQLLFT